MKWLKLPVMPLWMCWVADPKTRSAILNPITEMYFGRSLNTLLLSSDDDRNVGWCYVPEYATARTPPAPSLIKEGGWLR